MSSPAFEFCAFLEFSQIHQSLLVAIMLCSSSIWANSSFENITSISQLLVPWQGDSVIFSEAALLMQEGIFVNVPLKSDVFPPHLFEMCPIQDLNR